MVVHACNPSSQERVRQEDPEFEASQGYIARTCLKKKKKKVRGKKKRKFQAMIEVGFFF
jgi:hypothetical protein